MEEEGLQVININSATVNNDYDVACEYIRNEILREAQEPDNTEAAVKYGLIKNN